MTDAERFEDIDETAKPDGSAVGRDGITKDADDQ
jgi:hypothetical protein